MARSRRTRHQKAQKGRENLLHTDRVKARRRESAEKSRWSALDSLARPPELAPIRPAAAWVFSGLALGFVLWLGSLKALFDAQSHSAFLVSLAMVVDLLATPLLLLFWSPALFSRALGSTPGARPSEVTLTYHVMGKDGGAMLSLPRPRLLLRTARTLLVMTRLGPRLVPRFVLSSGRMHELTLANRAFALREVQAPKVRVAISKKRTRVAPVLEAAPVADQAMCVECSEPLRDDGQACEMCVDPVHDGECASRHARRHEGASGGRAYR